MEGLIWGFNKGFYCIKENSKIKLAILIKSQ